MREGEDGGRAGNDDLKDFFFFKEEVTGTTWDCLN